MTIWTPDLDRYPGPRYAALAASIAAAIADGALPPGTRLPTHRDLAFRLGCTVGTVSRAYALAEQRGLIAGQVGRGTFVRGGNTDEAPLGRQGETQADLARNIPNLALSAPFLREAMAEIAAAPGITALLDYPPVAGLPAHREAVARWVARHGVRASADQIVLTAGTQQALVAAILTLLRPGEILLCEAPGYAALREIAAICHIRLRGVPLDGRGMCPDALSRAARDSGARAVMVTPTLQNPTTATMDDQRRAEIAACAARYDLTVIEDDVYGELPARRPAAIAAQAAERVIYVGSLSKCLAPALRLGWAVAPPALAGRVAEAIGAMTHDTSPLCAELARLWMERGAKAGLPALRRDIADRQRVARTALAGLDPQGDPEALHLLLPLPAPWTEQEFSLAARDAGLQMVPLDAFRPATGSAEGAGTIADRAAMRITLPGIPDLRELAAALERVAALASRTAPAATRVI